MNQRLIPLFALATLSLLLAACGGGEPEATSLSFNGFDILTFAPNTASANAESLVEVTLNNRGVEEHSWVLVSQDADLKTVTEEDALAGATTGTVQSGESKTISFTAPAAGTYQYVCTIGDHAAQGMVGTMTFS
jgi:plastocyanin